MGTIERVEDHNGGLGWKTRREDVFGGWGWASRMGGGGWFQKPMRGKRKLVVMEDEMGRRGGEGV